MRKISAICLRNVAYVAFFCTFCMQKFEEEKKVLKNKSLGKTELMHRYFILVS